MRTRSVLVSLFLVAVAAPASAAAKTGSYSGSLEGAASSQFALVAKLNKDGDPTKLTRLQWGYIAGTCSNGSNVNLTGQIQEAGKSFAVKRNGTFTVNYKRLDATGATAATYEVTGKFSRNGKKVTGSIRHEQPFGPWTCTGSANYTAKLGG
jgi:hypothetical protein